MKINRNTQWIKLLFLVVILMLGGSTLPKVVWGHASLEKAVPEANSQLQESPPSISLVFNERLDDGLYYIKLLNQNGNEATSNKAVINQQHNGIELAVPKLAEGIYVVSYHVISSDGHPISGTYPIIIGNPPESELQAPIKSSLTIDPHEHGGAGAYSISMILQYLSRGLWYLTMLALTGWIVWLRLIRKDASQIRKDLQFWTLNLQRAHLIAFLLLIFTHLEDLLGSQGIDQLFNFFTGTSVGINWLMLLGLSLLGFILLQRASWLDYLWVISLLAVKSFNGHAITFSPKVLTVLLDFIHLAAAAIWVGGLLMLAVRWKHSEQGTFLFLKAFSKAALASIIVLTLSGSASVLLFLPNLRYLTYSQWGIWLLIKIGVVGLVLVVAGILRYTMKKQREANIRRWFKIDFSLMLAIIVLVGFISYMSPIPTNKPLAWHVMGTEAHMSADITPKIQGTNTFIAKAWLPESLGKPKYVQMILTYMDDEEIAPIVVPLEPFTDKTQEESFGFAKYSYKAVGAYLPFRGNWSIQVRVMDSTDTERPYESTFIVY
ncbi:Copper transport protein YcnJ precursor [compost metagenome]